MKEEKKKKIEKTADSDSKPKKEIRAILRYLRMSPRKVRLVSDNIKGMNVNDALNYLDLLNKAAAKPLLKLLNSAIANAVNNFDYDKDTLFIKNIRVDQGPSLKRWTPRAFGRATQIIKRSSHIIIFLEGKSIAKKGGKKTVKDEEAAKIKTVSLKDIKKDSRKNIDAKRDSPSIKESEGVSKKMFSRKSGM